MPFVVVGHIVEPAVAFAQPSLNFQQVLVGHRGHATVELVNSEDLPFDFALDKATYDATEDIIRGSGKPPVISFEPTRGTVAPHSALPITATYTPDSERLMNYTVTCNVKQKPTPLTVNVKGEGYAVHAAVLLAAPGGQEVALSSTVRFVLSSLHCASPQCGVRTSLHPPQHGVQSANTVDFGQVIINDKCVRAVSIVNTGLIPIEFDWALGDQPRLSINATCGRVAVGERTTVELCYNPTSPHKLANHSVTCKIVNGGTFSLRLSGTGHKPKLHLSFFSHDFGTVFEHLEGAAVLEKVLLLRNDDTQVSLPFRPPVRSLLQLIGMHAYVAWCMSDQRGRGSAGNQLQR